MALVKRTVCRADVAEQSLAVWHLRGASGEDASLLQARPASKLTQAPCTGSCIQAVAIVFVNGSMLEKVAPRKLITLQATWLQARLSKATKRKLRRQHSKLHNKVAVGVHDACGNRFCHDAQLGFLLVLSQVTNGNMQLVVTRRFWMVPTTAQTQRSSLSNLSEQKFFVITFAIPLRVWLPPSWAQESQG